MLFLLANDNVELLILASRRVRRRSLKVPTSFSLSSCIVELQDIQVVIVIISIQVLLQMAHAGPRLLPRRVCQPSSIFQKTSNSLFTRNFRDPTYKCLARRSYATGESGPNPKPGQNPFKIWPFIAITLAGSGAYVLMVKSRAGMCQLPPLLQLMCRPSRAQFESRFKSQHSRQLCPTS